MTVAGTPSSVALTLLTALAMIVAVVLPVESAAPWASSAEKANASLPAGADMLIVQPGAAHGALVDCGAVPGCVTVTAIAAVDGDTHCRVTNAGAAVPLGNTI